MSSYLPVLCPKMLETVIGDLEKKLSLIWQAKRGETFTSWPISSDKPCSADKLAEAGFFFTGSTKEPDAVQCFLCDKALDGWDENDDPWAEHISHSADCSFARLRQSEEALSFQQMRDFKLQQIKKEFTRVMEALNKDSDKELCKELVKLKKQMQNVLNNF